MKKNIDIIIKFFTSDLWKLDHRVMKFPKRWGIVILKILTLAIRKYDQNDCFTKASSLTFFTLLSIVPAIAMGFGIAKGFGLEELMENALRKNLTGQEEVAEYMLSFSRSMLETTKGGIIAGVGLIMLFWTVIKLIDKIERAFNHSWKIDKTRNWSRKISNYMTIIITAPILIILSSSMTVFIKTIVNSATSKFTILEYASPLLMFFIEMAPYIIVWLLFMLIYYIIPFTKVEIKAALIAGIIAGTIFQLTQWAYINFQIGVGSYNAIYGSFAALPLFLIWMQTSWYITLFGVEISVSIQNFSKIRFDIEKMDISINQRNSIAVQTVNIIFKNLKDNGEPLTTTDIANRMNIPEFYVQNIITELLALKIIVPLYNEDTEDELKYLPMIDINSLSAKDLTDKLLNNNSSNFDFQDVKLTNELTN